MISRGSQNLPLRVFRRAATTRREISGICNAADGNSSPDRDIRQTARESGIL